MLLFSKQIVKGSTSVKIAAKHQRKGRVIDKNIDIGLILEEIEANEEY